MPFPALWIVHRVIKRWPVYYAMGNHEQCLKKWEAVQLYDGLKKAGVTVLENTWCDISRQGQTVRLYGLNMPLVYYKDPLGEYRKGAHFSTEDTRKFLGSMDPAFTISFSFPGCQAIFFFGAL